MQKTLLIFLVALLTGCAAQKSKDDVNVAALEAMLMLKAPHPNLNAEETTRVASFPLGTAENPVRAAGPNGQRAYLMRLRCPNGEAPRFQREGSAGSGPYGSIMDIYAISCKGLPPQSIYMDMYHIGYEESRAVQGLTTTSPSGGQ
jgi:hypothetical protein